MWEMPALGFTGQSAEKDNQYMSVRGSLTRMEISAKLETVKTGISS